MLFNYEIGPPINWWLLRKVLIIDSSEFALLNT